MAATFIEYIGRLPANRMNFYFVLAEIEFRPLADRRDSNNYVLWMREFLLAR